MPAYVFHLWPSYQSHMPFQVNKYVLLDLSANFINLNGDKLIFARIIAFILSFCLHDRFRWNPELYRGASYASYDDISIDISNLDLKGNMMKCVNFSHGTQSINTWHFQKTELAGFLLHFSLTISAYFFIYIACSCRAEKLLVERAHSLK